MASPLKIGLSIVGAIGLGFLARLLAPKVAQPEIGETEIPPTESRYGEPIAYGYGRTRMTGHILWAGNVERVEEEQRSGGGGKKGGKGRRGSSIKTWKYYQDVLVSFGSGRRAFQIRKIWTDSKEVDFEADDLFDGEEGVRIYMRGGEAPVVNNPSVAIPRNALGQTIDPLFEDKLDEVPAYTGHVLLAVARMPLGSFANRLPRFSAEIEYLEEGQSSTITEGDLEDPNLLETTAVAPFDFTAGNRVNALGVSLDAEANRLYVLLSKRSGSNVLPRLVVIAPGPPGRILRDRDIPAMVGSRAVHRLENANLLAVSNQRAVLGGQVTIGLPGQGDPINAVFNHKTGAWEHGDALSFASRWGPRRSSDLNSALFAAFFQGDQSIVAAFHTAPAGSDTRGSSYFLTYRFVNGKWQRSNYAAGSSDSLGPYDWEDGFNDRILTPVSFGSFVLIGFVHNIHIRLVRVGPIEDFRTASPINEAYTTTPCADVHSDITTFLPRAAGVTMIRRGRSGQAFIFVASNRGLEIILVSSSGEYTGQVWNPPGSTADDVPQDGEARRGPYIRGNYVYQTAANEYILMNWESRLFIRVSDYSVLGPPNPLIGIFVTNGKLRQWLFYIWRGQEPEVEVWGNIGAGGSTGLIPDIIKDVGRQCGVPEDGIVINEGLGPLAPEGGFRVSNQTSGKAIIRPLVDIFQLLVRETGDGKIEVMPRAAVGTTPALTVDARDLLSVQLREEDVATVLNKTQKNESEIPRIQEITYTNRDRSYQSSTASFRRPRSPEPSTLSEDRDSLSAPLVVQPREAKSASEVILTRKWVERDFYSIAMSYRALALEPGDILALIDGPQRVLLDIASVEIGTNFVVLVEATVVSAGLYAGTGSEGDGGTPVQPPVITVPVADLYILQIPLLEDRHAAPAGRDRKYAATAPDILVDGTWSGAQVYRVAGDDLDQLGGTSGGVVKGITANAVGDPASPWRVDRDNHIDVYVEYGAESFANAPLSQLLDHDRPVNVGVLIKENGDTEILQFMTATEIPDQGVWRLSGLLRGRRGTEWAAYGHKSGEQFLMLNVSGVVSYDLPVEGIDATPPIVYRYVALTTSQRFNPNDVVSQQNRGESLRPYAPVHIGAVRLTNGDILIYWTRRTRIGGALRNFTSDVPVSEGSDRYDVEVVSGEQVIHAAPGVPGGTRPSGSLPYSTSGYTFSLTDQLNSGFTGDEISVRVYQLSDEVGRGFTGSRTITLE